MCGKITQNLHFYILLFLLCTLCNLRPYEGSFSNAGRIGDFFDYGLYTDWEFEDYYINNAIYKDNIINSIMDYGLNMDYKEHFNDSFVLLYKRGMFNSIIKLKPINFYQYYIKTFSFYKLGFEDSVNYYIKILKNYNKDSDIIKLIEAAILINKEQYNEAKSILSALNNDYANFMKAVCYMYEKKMDKALDLLESINNKAIREQQIDLLTDIYIKKKYFSQALLLIEEFEDYFSQSLLYFNIIYKKGLIYYKQGFFDKSIDILKFVARNTLNSNIKGNAYYLIGKNYFMKGDYENMEKFLSYVKNPLIPSDYKKNAEFLDGKGMFFNKNYKKAIKKMRAFIEKYPNDFLTPYAYQILAQSYFYINDFEQSLYYINKLEKPEFIVDKLVEMKYFIDYKKGVYADSIMAYEEFLKNETNNPLRNEAYQYIIENESDNNKKIKYFMDYLYEYGIGDKIIRYYEELIDYMIFYEHFEYIFKASEIIINNMKQYRLKILKSTIIKFYESEYYDKLIEYYSKFISNEVKDNYIIFLTSKALLIKKNRGNAKFLLENSIDMKDNDTYMDSLIILLSDIYRESGDIKNINRLLYNALGNNKKELSANILLNKGKLLRENRNYIESLNIFIMAAELFTDDRNNAANCLYEAAYSAYLNNDYEYALLLLNRAKLLATHIDIVNRIKVLYEKINN